MGEKLTLRKGHVPGGGAAGLGVFGAPEVTAARQLPSALPRAPGWSMELQSLQMKAFVLSLLYVK